MKGINALVVQDHFKKLQEENQAVLGDRKTVPQSKALLTKDRVGTFIGHKAGDMVEINRSVE